MSDLDDYYASLSPERRHKLESLRGAFLAAVPGVEETMRYRMPTFERDGRWVCLASQKQYVSVYFCHGGLVAPIKARHPKLSTGKGCVRVRDTQDLPVEDLVAAFTDAMKMDKPARPEPRAARKGMT